MSNPRFDTTSQATPESLSFDTPLSPSDNSGQTRSWADVSRDVFDTMRRTPLGPSSIDSVLEGGRLVFNSIFGPKKVELPDAETLASVMRQYHGLETHMRPGVISALIENESLNIRNDWKDKPEEWGVSFLHNLRQRLGRGSITDYFCTTGNANVLERLGDSVIGRIRPGLGVRHISIGPGQIQIQNICALRAQDRYGGNRHSMEGSLTVNGASDLIGGYMQREVDRFTRKDHRSPSGEAMTYYELQAQNERLSPELRDRYRRMQALWNEGGTTGGETGMRQRELALIWSYNPGVGRSGAQRIQDRYVRA